MEMFAIRHSLPSRCLVFRSGNDVRRLKPRYNRALQRRVVRVAETPEIIETVEVDPAQLSKLTMLPPFPGAVQQTLWKSFTIIGVGLHSGEVSCVRVRPAFAGEGRYFVRVPPGTIPEPGLPYEEVEIEMNPAETDNMDVDAEVLRSELFLKYLDYVESEGYIGQFGEFIRDYAKLTGLGVNWRKKADVKEEPMIKSKAEAMIPAVLENILEEDNPYRTSLENEEGDRVESVEYLLGALEACGVDNARIEIEGGFEIPSVDGSAACWSRSIREAGVGPASPRKNEAELIFRAAMKPDEMIGAQNGDAFIILTPSERMELTCGIDHSKESPVIGRQWYTWCLQNEQTVFGDVLSLAKGYATDKEALREAVRKGFFKGVHDNVIIIGEGKEWYSGSDLTYPKDEPVRHKLLELIGDLSLLGKNGMAGIPFGHIIAYKADHSLHYQFAKKIKDKFTQNYVRYKEDVEENISLTEETEINQSEETLSAEIENNQSEKE